MTGWLHEQRLEAVRDVIREKGARTILDLGCGNGDLLIRIIREDTVDRVIGVDLDERSLEQLRARLLTLPDHAFKVELVQGSLLDQADRLNGFDCAILVETIEHIHVRDLGSLEQAVFGRLRPKTVIITTPNSEFNALLGVPANRFRHPGHRFEWDRVSFRNWASGIAERQDYKVECTDIAGQHPRLGGASQMAVFGLT